MKFSYWLKDSQESCCNAISADTGNRALRLRPVCRQAFSSQELGGSLIHFLNTIQLCGLDSSLKNQQLGIEIKDCMHIHNYQGTHTKYQNWDEDASKKVSLLLSVDTINFYCAKILGNASSVACQNIRQNQVHIKFKVANGWTNPLWCYGG